MRDGTLDIAWADAFELPASGNMMKAGPEGRGVFVRQGTRMFAVIEDQILRHRFSRPIEALDVLDFGCGVGRVAMPFFHRYGRPSACVDVEAAAIAFMQRTLPGANPSRIGYEPPTPFPNASFDVVFSISVWTHLPPDLQEPWLAEIKRLLRPGGLALISTSGFAALASRRSRLTDWAGETDEDLRRKGLIFKPVAGHRHLIPGEYGYTLHTPDYVADRWSRHMRVLATLSGAIERVQDLNVMIKASRRDSDTHGPSSFCKHAEALQAGHERGHVDEPIGVIRAVDRLGLPRLMASNNTERPPRRRQDVGLRIEESFIRFDIDNHLGLSSGARYTDDTGSGGVQKGVIRLISSTRMAVVEHDIGAAQ